LGLGALGFGPCGACAACAACGACGAWGVESNPEPTTLKPQTPPQASDIWRPRQAKPAATERSAFYARDELASNDRTHSWSEIQAQPRHRPFQGASPPPTHPAPTPPQQNPTPRAFPGPLRPPSAQLPSSRHGRAVPAAAPFELRPHPATAAGDLHAALCAGSWEATCQECPLCLCVSFYVCMSSVFCGQKGEV
jgi:hypothetical protein